tara:strand:- start:10 stop:2358 length:2349 start_codon:yes stop_codon:yes gene_type:complete
MSELVHGVDLATLRNAIQAHELQGYEDLGPYIFTKVSKKKRGTSSSGFGPGQITASTAEDMLARYPSLFNDEEFKNYVSRFIVQGNNKLNIDYDNALFKDGRRQRTTKNDRTIFGPLGKGNISEEDHKKHYDKLFNIVIRDKAKQSDSLDSFLKKYHGSIIPEKNVDYSNSVKGKLSDLGMTITGTSDPETFEGEPVSAPMAVPMSKPDKPKMPVPEPKPQREQFIDQPGEIKDTGDDVPIRDEKDDNPFKYVPFLRHLPKFMADGGAVPMKEQMELFQDGGLKDEGGTTDPISGNDVPPGSTQEEVRDDIPAQLSEGEFVFPADVVRYIGLEKLMQMRQEAKQGLKMMERMGQMGNGNEAVVSDDIPFDLSDLDMSDDLEYNVGGVVPGVQQNPQFTGIGGYRPPQMDQSNMGYVPAPMPQYQSPQLPGLYQPPQQAAVPIAQPPTPLPQFGQLTEQNIETREYINPTTGERRIFTFIGGQPTVAIPEGFIPSSQYVAPETPKPANTAVETTSVVSPDSDERDDSDDGFGPGGGRLAFGGQTFGVSFEPAGEGLPGMLGALGTIPKAVAGNLPDDTIVNFKNANTAFSVSGSQYNNLKAIIKGEGANSPTAEMYLEDIQQDYRDNIANIANAYKLDSSGKSSTQILKEASEASGQDVDDLIRGAKARRDLERHNAEVARKAADKRRQEEQAAAVRERQAAQERAAERARTEAAIRAARERDRDDDRDDVFADLEDRQIEQETANRQAVDRANEAMGRDRGFRGFDDGGLVKMKRGELASKK